MKNISGCVFFVFFLTSVSCSTSAFSTRDRWEGWRDGRVRIYIQVKQTDAEAEPDETKTASPDDAVYVRLAGERAALLGGQYRTAAGTGLPTNAGMPDIDLGSGRVVHKKCDENKCEAFVDFSLMGPVQ